MRTVDGSANVALADRHAATLHKDPLSGKAHVGEAHWVERRRWRTPPQTTIEAVMYCVRERGLAALREPANQLAADYVR